MTTARVSTIHREYWTPEASFEGASRHWLFLCR